MNTFLIVLASFAGAVVFGSFFEWAIHKYIMHGVLVKGYPYEAHDRVHHQVFDGAAGYHLKTTGRPELVTMAWWNGPALILANTPLPVLIAWWTGSWWVLAGALPAFAIYYCAYEYLHWCMHVPRKRWFEKSRAFRWLDRHHRIHHDTPMRNLNVVFPLADFVMRSRIAFAPV